VTVAAIIFMMTCFFRNPWDLIGHFIKTIPSPFNSNLSMTPDEITLVTSSDFTEKKEVFASGPPVCFGAS